MNFQKLSQNRRSVNFFDPDRDVSQDLVRQMVEMAAASPSSFNLQPWNLIVLRDKDEKKRLKSLAWDQPKVVEAPASENARTGVLCLSPLEFSNAVIRNCCRA